MINPELTEATLVFLRVLKLFEISSKEIVLEGFLKALKNNEKKVVKIVSKKKAEREMLYKLFCLFGLKSATIEALFFEIKQKKNVKSVFYFFKKSSF